ALGPEHVVAHLAAFVVIARRRKAWRAVRSGGWMARAALVIVAFGMAANVAWGVAVQPHPGMELGAMLRDIGPSIGDLPKVFRQAVAVFGWQDVPAPLIVPLLWGILFLGITALALLVGCRRQR